MRGEGYVTIQASLISSQLGHFEGGAAPCRMNSRPLPALGSYTGAAYRASVRWPQDGDYSRDSGERDELRLAELGRAAVHMYIMSHIFLEKLEVRFEP